MGVVLVVRGGGEEEEMGNGERKKKKAEVEVEKRSLSLLSLSPPLVVFLFDRQKKKKKILTHTPREISHPASARALAMAHPKPWSSATPAIKAFLPVNRV